MYRRNFLIALVLGTGIAGLLSASVALASSCNAHKISNDGTPVGFTFKKNDCSGPQLLFEKHNVMSGTIICKFINNNTVSVYLRDNYLYGQKGTGKPGVAEYTENYNYTWRDQEHKQVEQGNVIFKWKATGKSRMLLRFNYLAKQRSSGAERNDVSAVCHFETDR